MSFVIAEVDSTPQSKVAEKFVAVEFYNSAITNTTYFILIDLDGGGGDYKHSGSSSVKVVSSSARIIKERMISQWKSMIGIILAINGTDATIGWLHAVSLYATDTARLKSEIGQSTKIFGIDLAQTAGDFDYIVAGNIETNVTAVNTGANLDNVKGNAVTPAVGDVILKVEKVSGGGSAEVSYSMTYFVD
jgi:hypothetical protein